MNSCSRLSICYSLFWPNGFPYAFTFKATLHQREKRVFMMLLLQSSSAALLSSSWQITESCCLCYIFLWRARSASYSIPRSLWLQRSIIDGDCHSKNRTRHETIFFHFEPIFFVPFHEFFQIVIKIL